jgi:16S rRNA (adenine(1408)-N(1))-methyltransferase
VRRSARARLDALVIGIDADVASMRDASRRAAARGGEPNALFVAAAVEALPRELDAAADEVRIHFPWGSLLRGLIHGGDDVLGPVGRLCGPGAELFALWSVTARDAGSHASAPRDPWELAPAFERHGLELTHARPATAEEVAATESSWAKRLHAPSSRPVTLLRARRLLPGVGAC